MDFEYTGKDNIIQVLNHLLEYKGRYTISDTPRPRVTIHRILDDRVAVGSVDILEDMILLDRQKTGFGSLVYFFKSSIGHQLSEVCLIDNIVKIIIHIEEEWLID